MGQEALRRAMAGKRLVVFDYDDTLAHLAIDWDAVREALSDAACGFGFASSFRPLWPEMARLQDECGRQAVERLFAVLAPYEQQGVEHQVPRRDIAEVVRGAEQQLAVFSSNLHATVAAGLEAMGLSDAIWRIVGADDVPRWKPDPAGLSLLLDLAGCLPGEVLMVGNSRQDGEAAAAARVGFLRV